MKRKSRFLEAALLLIVFAFLFSSCIGLENVEKIKFNILIEEEKGPQEGYLSLQVIPKGEDKFQGTVDFKLGDEEFSTTFTTEEGSLENAITPLIFSNPSLAGILGVVSSAQLMLTPFLFTGEELKEGSMWREKNEEGQETETTITSSETRFGKEALWIEVKTDGIVVIQMLAEKETYLPLVLDIRDETQLESGQQRIYLEVEEIVWQE
ncbi:MAG: hypothetical protein PWP04_941 [Candidatus Atribacteria bacterium]|nr:hypothetical protein [Candidatus Atribacteria bacterium]